MAKFLNTQGVSYYLKELIENSNDKLYLISPYLQLNNQLKLSLEDRHKFSIDIIIIYGKVTEINPAESEWLKSMPGIKLMFHQDLHAKCYFNEKEAIITSMNLYMFSQQNNVEMGIYITKEKDEELYTQIANEVDRIKRGSEHRTISVQKVETKKDDIPKPTKKKETKATPGQGHCIRCDKTIKLNPLVPYCKDCYNIWKKYGDDEYQENHCHICGKDETTTMLKPTCYSCYKTNKNKLEFNV